MINLRNEELLTLSDAAKLKLWPRRRGGKRIHVATLFRLAASGELDTVRVGSTLCTSETACIRYIERCTAGGRANKTPSEIDGDATTARNGLTAAGI